MSTYFVHLADLKIEARLIDCLRYLITPSTHSIYNADERREATAFIEQHAIESYETAQSANDRKLARQKDSDQTYAVTFVADYDALQSWQDREDERMQVDYMPVPWKIAPIYARHYAHMSIALAGQIAYTKNEEHGIADRQTRVKPGRYLQQYYSLSNATAVSALRAIGHDPDRWLFSDRQIADFAEQCTAENLTLKTTNDPREIVSIYLNGPRSCMTRAAEKYAGHDHPAIVYGGPLSSLTMAYHGTIDAPTSRALINVEKKTVVRVYPNNNCALAKLLRANGYDLKDSDRDYSHIIGNTIPAIEDGNGYGYLMPYVDGADYAYLTKDGKQFVLGTYLHPLIDRYHHQSFMCQLTQDLNGDTIALGVTDPDASDRDRDDDDDDMFTCENCGDRYHSDNMSGHDSSLCDGCGDSIFRACAICDEYVDTRETNCSNHTLRIGSRTVRRSVCETCIDDRSRTCENCSNEWIDGYDGDVDHGDDGDLCETCADDAREAAEQNDEAEQTQAIAVASGEPIARIEDGTNITISMDDSVVAYGSIHCIDTVFRVLRVQFDADGDPSFVQCSDPINREARVIACDTDLSKVSEMFAWFTENYPDSIYVIVYGHSFVRSTSDRFVTWTATDAASCARELTAAATEAI